MDNGAKVCDGIYIGSLSTALNQSALDMHNIGAIINLSNVNYKSSLPVYTIEIEDVLITQQTLKSYLEKFQRGVVAINKARAAGKNVLVHCAAGINRSATLIGCYMIDFGNTYDDVILKLSNANASRGTQILTNPTFRQLLQMRYSIRKA